MQVRKKSLGDVLEGRARAVVFEVVLSWGSAQMAIFGCCLVTPAGVKPIGDVEKSTESHIRMYGGWKMLEILE